MTRREFAALTAASVAGWPWAACATGALFQRVADEMAWAGIPGASLATVSARAIQSAHFGMSDVAQRLPVTSATVFEAASLSKPVFAYAALQLVTTGKLHLDRSLDSYLTARYPIDDSLAERITARHVLTHTSGLPNWRPDNGKALTLLFTPGLKYNYSGEGFYFLQTAVESITGTSMAQFMRKALDALGMRRSSYVWRESYAADSALPYDRDGKPMMHDTALLGRRLTAAAERLNKRFETLTTAEVLAALPRLHPPQTPVPHNAMPNAAWSLLTTAGDYAKFVQRLLKHPEHPMLRPALQLSPYVWRGLGVALQKRGPKLAFFHTGANPGFKSVMFGDLTAGRGVVSFTNSQGGFPFNMHALENEMGDQPAVFYLEQP